MKINELRQLTPKKLQEFLQKTLRTLARTKFLVKTGQEKDVSQIRKSRRLVAQIKTLQSQPQS